MSYVVASKVKELLKSKGCMMAGDYVDALNSVVEWYVTKSAERAAANGRKTARSTDV